MTTTTEPTKTMKTKKIELHQIDAFTATLFGGNPAGVVTNADNLTEQEMADIAREMNLSETAFVLRPESAQADIRLRYFTPTNEVKFCGHATVATLFQLAKLDRFGLGGQGGHEIHVETGVGVLTMIVTATSATAAPQVTFTAASLHMEPYRLQGEAFADEFGIPGGSIHPGSTIFIDRAEQFNFVYIPVASLDSLGALTYDPARVRERFSHEDTIVIFCFFIDETMDKAAGLHARSFGPLIGLVEDPFTGAMQAGLVYAAKQNGLIAANQEDIRTEQGHFMGRPGSAHVHHDSKTDAVRITADAVHVFSTNLEMEV